MAGLNELDLQHVRACFALARSAKQRGDTPFGARLVGPDGEVLLEASNATISTRDATAHAEIMLVRTGSACYSAAELGQMTLYSSAEPCAMCAGAIAWSGIGRVVFGLSAERVRELAQPALHAPTLAGRVVLESAAGAPSVSGPVLEAEAAALFVDDASTLRPDSFRPLRYRSFVPIALLVRFCNGGIRLLVRKGWDMGQ